MSKDARLEQWDIARDHILKFAAYVLRNGGLDIEREVNGRKVDAWVLEATIAGAIYGFDSRKADDAPLDRLRRTPTESEDARYMPPGDIIREFEEAVTEIALDPAHRPTSRYSRALRALQDLRTTETDE